MKLIAICFQVALNHFQHVKTLTLEFRNHFHINFTNDNIVTDREKSVAGPDAVIVFN